MVFFQVLYSSAYAEGLYAWTRKEGPRPGLGADFVHFGYRSRWLHRHPPTTTRGRGGAHTDHLNQLVECLTQASQTSSLGAPPNRIPEPP